LHREPRGNQQIRDAVLSFQTDPATRRQETGAALINVRQDFLAARRLPEKGRVFAAPFYKTCAVGSENASRPQR